MCNVVAHRDPPSSGHTGAWPPASCAAQYGAPVFAGAAIRTSATSRGTAAPRARGGGPRARRAGRSFAKMLVTCFSTARGEMKSRSPIAWFVRPSAISSSTSRSRGESRSTGSSPRLRPTSSATTSGSSAEPPSATRRDGGDELVDVGDAVLEQVAEPLGAVAEQLDRVACARRAARGRARPSPGASRGSRCAARMPSSVCVGGMRMSTIATSGW